MKENSIEEDIAKVNTYIELVLEKDYCNCNELNTILGKHCDGSKNVAYAIEHILSDYKRILKENEELLEVKVSASAHNRILELEKENEELKEEIGVDYTTVYLKGVYDEREKQQKEIKEKNKIINLMAEHIFYNQDDTFPLAYSIKDTKDYFENKAKKR